MKKLMFAWSGYVSSAKNELIKIYLLQIRSFKVQSTRPVLGDWSKISNSYYFDNS